MDPELDKAIKAYEATLREKQPGIWPADWIMYLLVAFEAGWKQRDRLTRDA
jgi:hypothetical protein